MKVWEKMRDKHYPEMTREQIAERLGEAGYCPIDGDENECDENGNRYSRLDEIAETVSGDQCDGEGNNCDDCLEAFLDAEIEE